MIAEASSGGLQIVVHGQFSPEHPYRLEVIGVTNWIMVDKIRAIGALDGGAGKWFYRKQSKILEIFVKSSYARTKGQALMVADWVREEILLPDEVIRYDWSDALNAALAG